MVINLYSGDGSHGKSTPEPGGGGCTSGTCGEGLEKVYPAAAVRFGYMKTVGEFKYASKDMRFGCGAEVVVQTHRGIELGEMVSLTCDGCDKCVSRDKIKSYIQASGPGYYEFGSGRILRLATKADLGDWAHIRAETLRKKSFCQSKADEMKIGMKVIECEHLFGGERIVFFFMSEGRVDFRGLVKTLASEFQTRIEMRQVGARDEARLLADYETCGRECCCKNFLKTLKPVNMKMAKMQKATLDPAKVSGRCGRLKCCLRYEHTSYEDLNRRLPSVGTRVFTASDTGTVVDRQILTQLMQIQTRDGGRITVTAEALISQAEYEHIQSAPPPPPPAPEPAAKPAAASESGDERQRGRRSRGRRPRGRGPRDATRGNVASSGSTDATSGGTGPSGAAGPPGAQEGSTKPDSGEQRPRRSRRSPRSRRRRGSSGGGETPTT